jgi:hypothetical protein
VARGLRNSLGYKRGPANSFPACSVGQVRECATPIFAALSVAARSAVAVLTALLGRWDDRRGGVPLVRHLCVRSLVNA